MMLSLSVPITFTKRIMKRRDIAVVILDIGSSSTGRSPLSAVYLKLSSSKNCKSTGTVAMNETKRAGSIDLNSEELSTKVPGILIHLEAFIMLGGMRLDRDLFDLEGSKPRVEKAYR